jgi:hypothetical protein
MPDVHVSAEFPRGHDGLFDRVCRACPHRPEVGLQRDRDIVTEARHVSLGEIEDVQVSVREVFGQQTESGENACPPPALRTDIEDVDPQRIAGLSTVDGDRPIQWVRARPVEVLERAGIRAGRDLVVADVTRPNNHRVAGIDDESRRVSRIPFVMSLSVR